MKIFLSGKALSEQFRAARRPVLVQDQASIGFVVESGLCDAEHDERINSAADHGENNGRHESATEFGK